MKEPLDFPGSRAMIARAMAATLTDHGIDPRHDDETRAVRVLIAAGFAAPVIGELLDDALTMAAVRIENDKRRAVVAR